MHDDDLVDAWRALAANARRHRDGEDYLQDAVVAALDERRRTGATPASARAWLRTVARRREVDQVRRNQCERRVAYAEDTGDDVALEVADRHEATWLAGHVESLPAKTRAVVRALAQGRTQRDVATELDLTPRAVEAHVRRARIALRRALDAAGTLVPIGFLRRRWKRLVPVAAAGVATAVGVALIGAPDSAMLIPVPPKPHPAPDPDRTFDPGGGMAIAPGLAAVALGRSGAAGRPGRQWREQAGEEEPPAPGQTPPPGTVPPLPADLATADSNGKPASTTFRTKVGVQYDVTVAGMYSYNGRDGLADCGHYIPEETEVWSVYDALLVDGVPAPCNRMPVDPAHVYRWRIAGTGRAVTFRVQDAGGNQDNIGRLTISLREVVA